MQLYIGNFYNWRIDLCLKSKVLKQKTDNYFPTKEERLKGKYAYCADVTNGKSYYGKWKT